MENQRKKAGKDRKMTIGMKGSSLEYCTRYARSFSHLRCDFDRTKFLSLLVSQHSKRKDRDIRLAVFMRAEPLDDFWGSLAYK